MSLETTWYHFELTFADADPLVDKIPAASETEARQTMQRIYGNARVIRLVKTETKANLAVGVEQAFAKAQSLRTSGLLIKFTCPYCGNTLSFLKSQPPESIRCDSCQATFTVTLAQKGCFLIMPVVASNEATPEPTDAPWWDVLQCDPAESTRAIRTAYLEQIRRYHPDKVAHLGEALIELAEARTAAINRALQEALKAKRSQ